MLAQRRNAGLSSLLKPPRIRGGLPTGGARATMGGLGWPEAQAQNMGTMSQLDRTATRRNARGFTLVEIMIAVVIVAILASVALPSFMDSVRKARRSEAFAAISAVQQAQERWRGSRTAYSGNLSAAPTADPPGLNIPASTAKGYYTLALTDPSTTGYGVTATATGTQAADTRCAKLVAKVDGGRLIYGSQAAAAAEVDWTDSNRCWVR